MEILPGRFAFLRAGFDGAFEDDRFPHAPRLDRLRAALAKLDGASDPTPLKGPGGSLAKRARR